MFMNELQPGDTARIMAIDGGMGMIQKLKLRGISEGSILRVVSCNSGPMVLELNGSTIAIGRKMASRMIVRKIGD